MSLPINFAGVQASQNFEPVAAGTYEVAVHAVKAKKSSTGKPMLEWVFEIQEEGDAWGHRIFTNTILEANSLWRTKDFLLALGFSEEELAAEFELDPADLVGLGAMAVLGVEEYQGQKRNRVVRLNKLSEGASIPTWAEEEPEEVNPDGPDAPEDTEGYDDGFEAESEPEEAEDAPAEDVQEEAPYTIPDDLKVSASARKLATEHQVPLEQITPTGPGKSYVLKDIQAWIEANNS